ncbi:uncharacterized protein FPRN_03269 [Fusarium proliferatum]|nr:uncharacterized protein FPRN_03269 [Fusarium proliferatum]
MSTNSNTMPSIILHLSADDLEDLLDKKLQPIFSMLAAIDEKLENLKARLETQEDRESETKSNENECTGKTVWTYARDYHGLSAYPAPQRGLETSNMLLTSLRTTQLSTLILHWILSYHSSSQTFLKEWEYRYQKHEDTLPEQAGFAKGKRRSNRPIAKKQTWDEN